MLALIPDPQLPHFGNQIPRTTSLLQKWGGGESENELMQTSKGPKVLVTY